MKKDCTSMIIIRDIALWRTLKAIALIILAAVALHVMAEAYTLGQTFVWMESRILKLTWSPSGTECDHYRIEISRTNLVQEPVTTYLSYAYVRDNHFQIELEDDRSYMFRVQSVSSYGTLSDFSDSSPLFVYRGEDVISGVSSIDATHPVEFSLSQNYPNPSNSRTRIEYQIPGSDITREGTRVHLAIYNVLGQCVRVLVDEIQGSEKYYIDWDGRDNAGQEVAAGRYLYQLTAGEFRDSKKIILLK